MSNGPYNLIPFRFYSKISDIQNSAYSGKIYARRLLGADPGYLSQTVRAKRGLRLPAVLTPDEGYII